MPDALPDATLPISRLGTGSTNGSNNGRGWGKCTTCKSNNVPLIKTVEDVNQNVSLYLVSVQTVDRRPQPNSLSLKQINIVSL
jgi:hypothetical protein